MNLKNKNTEKIIPPKLASVCLCIEEAQTVVVKIFSVFLFF